MVQEATMIVVDNSDYMRNGDFIPTRLQSQSDAVSLICQSKRQSHPENTVGLMTLAKNEVLVTLTTDVSKIYTRMHMVQPRGDSSFVVGIRIAHLALRHRLSRNQKMKIVCFVGSPVIDDEKELIRLAKRLKKEKVSVDVINFGEDEHNQGRLSVFVDTVNGKEGGGSHLVTVPPGSMLHDSLVSSPIILGEDGSGAVPGFGMEFGVDPNEDPELALALRVSLEDQRMRQEADAARARGEGGLPLAPVPEGGSDVGVESTVLGQSTLPATGGTNEENFLQQALSMSMGGADLGGVAGEGAGKTTTSLQDIDFASLTEEQQIEYALQMSMQQGEESAAPNKDTQQDNISNAAVTSSAVPMEVEESTATPTTTGDTGEDLMCDPAFLQSVLESLPGVDPQSDEVRSAMGSFTAAAKKKKDDDKK